MQHRQWLSSPPTGLFITFQILSTNFSEGNLNCRLHSSLRVRFDVRVRVKVATKALAVRAAERSSSMRSGTDKAAQARVLK